MRSESFRVNGPYLSALFLLLLGGVAYAQDDGGAEEAAVNAQNPAPINTFQAEGGYRWDYRPPEDNEFWARISYKGALIREVGTPFKDAKSLDLAAPVTSTGAGDRNKWSVRYEDGTTTVGGGLLEAEGVQPITLRQLEKLDLRGTAYVGGDTDGGTVQIAAGLESRPFRIPFMSRTGASNWIVLGVNAQRQEDPDGQTGDGNMGLLTLRMFLGKAFGWRKSASVAETAKKLEAQLLKQAPTFEDGGKLAEDLKRIPANQRTKLQQLLLDTLGDVDESDDWPKAIQEMAIGTADAITDQPTVAVYGEASGWQTFSGDPQGRRFKILATLTTDYWFLPVRDDVFLRVRYEHGYERALPTVKLNQLMISAGLKF